MRPLWVTACTALVLTLAPIAGAQANEQPVQRGEASFYDAERFAGRPMANGDRFDPNSNSAAHRTLPLGTVAEVTNRETGEKTTVVIEDRGPYAGRNRVIDLSPRSAQDIGINEQQGVAPVEVRPVGQVPNKARDD